MADYVKNTGKVVEYNCDDTGCKKIEVTEKGFWIKAAKPFRPSLGPAIPDGLPLRQISSAQGDLVGWLEVKNLQTADGAPVAGMIVEGATPIAPAATDGAASDQTNSTGGAQSDDSTDTLIIVASLAAIAFMILTKRRS